MPSQSHGAGAVEAWALGIQHGSGGKERVIGLRCAVLFPDWVEKCENEEDERRESADPAAAQPLQSPLIVPVPRTHTEDWDVTVYRRNTTCFCGIFSVRMMGEERQGVRVAMPATWVAVLLGVITSVCAVEGRWAMKGHFQCWAGAGWRIQLIDALSVGKARGGKNVYCPLTWILPWLSLKHQYVYKNLQLNLDRALDGLHTNLIWRYVCDTPLHYIIGSFSLFRWAVCVWGVKIKVDCSSAVGKLLCCLWSLNHKGSNLQDLGASAPPCLHKCSQY